MIFEAFEFFDTDHNGTLEEGEIKYAMQILGYPTNIDEIQKLIRTYGSDGSVDFDHFTDFVLDKMVFPFTFIVYIHILLFHFFYFTSVLFNIFRFLLKISNTSLVPSSSG